MLDILTPPAQEPVSVAEAKAYARIHLDEEDTVIADVIAAARAQVEAATGRALLTQTLRWSLPASPQTDHVILPRAPATSLLGVETLSGEGDVIAHGTETFLLVGGEAVRPIPGTAWPGTAARGLGAFRIRFEAGYGSDPSAVPAALREAVLVLTSARFESRADAGTGLVEGLIAPYRRLHLT